MNLFLDIISPFPEFSVINYNKIILSEKIITTNKEKLSDKIIDCYQNLNKTLNFDKSLKKIIVTTGPGSYTSLRVGIAFAKGLQYSKNLYIAGISCEDQYNYLSIDNKNIGIFIISANLQKFFCYQNKNGKFIFTKIENNSFIIPKYINKIYYNFKCKDIMFKDFKKIKFYFKNDILNNSYKINYYKKKIIKPIYISNNKILN